MPNVGKAPHYIIVVEQPGIPHLEPLCQTHLVDELISFYGSIQLCGNVVYQFANLQVSSYSEFVKPESREEIRKSESSKISNASTKSLPSVQADPFEVRRRFKTKRTG